MEDWATFLKKKYGTNLQRVDSFDNPTTLAQFAEEMYIIGYQNYTKNAPLKGVKEIDYTEENLIRRYHRERYVYNSLIANKELFGLNGQELWHAKAYFYEIELSLIERGIKIPK